MLQESFSDQSSEEISKEHAALKKAGEKENTLRAKRSDWADFESWCHENGRTSLPASLDSVDRYLADRATDSRSVAIKGRGGSEKIRVCPPLKASSLKRRIETIKYVHAEAGYTKASGYDYNLSNPKLSKTWKGILATQGSSVTKKSPLLVEDVRSAVRAIPIEQDGKVILKGLRDRALFLIGFMGCFRGSELLGLRMEHRQKVEMGMELTLFGSKTDKENHGMIKVIPYGLNVDCCPVRTTSLWLESAGIRDGYIFRAMDRHGNIKETPLTVNSFSRLIKENLYIRSLAEKKARSHLQDHPVGSESLEQLIELFLGDFASHSLRRGFITSAHKSGVDAVSTMRQSGHKRFETYRGYIEDAERWEGNAASALRL